MPWQSPVEGSVMAASATEELTTLLWRMTDPSITAELVTELKKCAEVAKESRPKEVCVASWTSAVQCRNPRQRKVNRLLTEAGEEGSYSCGEDHG